MSEENLWKYHYRHLPFLLQEFEEMARRTNWAVADNHQEKWRGVP